MCQELGVDQKCLNSLHYVLTCLPTLKSGIDLDVSYPLSYVVPRN